MRVAVLNDIHGNLPALEAVLDEVRAAHVDRIVVGGDVLPGPMPIECLDLLIGTGTPIQFIHGNGDREVLERIRGVDTPWYRAAREEWRVPVQWTAEQLSSEHARFVAEWPATCRVAVPGIGDVLFCHATPRNDTDAFTKRTPEHLLLPIFDVDAPMVVCGHTHMAFDRRIGAVRVVNTGSVGMPFGEPGADWLMLGPDVELRHTAYDLDRAADRIRRTSYPQAESFAAANVLSPPSEMAMLDAFTSATFR